ncbi:MAG: hypothetical protein EOO90_22315 [Pedobacter sp.]|nr:MAG: hypothetical protein EOO90_22315 [Pedobacter sp.]
MKTIKQSSKWFLIAVIAISVVACKKDKNDKEVAEILKQEKLTKKIQDIIPTQYLDSLKKLGLAINTGTNPAIVEGIYSIKPLILKSTNKINDYAIGTRFLDARLMLFEQTDNLDIKLIGKGFLGISDTSIVTAISGTGKDFTIYGKVKAINNNKEAFFAIIFSGTIENNTIKNLSYGLICVSNKNDINDKTFIKEGQGRVVFDSDFVSDRITEKEFISSINLENQILRLQNSGAIKPIFPELK